ncbi:MAG: IPT/TIG domain-containing protein, partial [Planctomycetota bacterium]
TGEYCLRVANTTPGADATIKDVVPAGDSGEYPFDLAENGSVTFEVRRAQGPFPLQPWLRRPDGSRDLSFDDLVKKKRFGFAGRKIPVRGPLGTYTLVVPGPTDGASTLKVTIRPGNSTNPGTKAFLPVAEPVIDASPNAIDVLNTDIGGLKPEEAKVGDSVQLFGTNIGETARVFLFSDPDTLGQGGTGIGEGSFEFPTPNQIVDRVEVPSGRATPAGDSIIFTIPDIALGEYQVYLCNPEGQIAPAGPRINIVEFAITGFTPVDGPASGFTEITVTGTGFEIGMTGVFIDENGVESPVGYWVDTLGNETAVDPNTGPTAGETYMPGVIFDSTTQARFVTPNHAPGIVDFRMDTPGMQDTFLVADAFEYLFRVDSILPINGPASGGTLVALTGEGFHPDMTATLVEDDGTRREVALTVTDPQNASFTTPFHLDLIVDIEVQNPPYMFTDINGDLIVQQMDPLNSPDAFEFIFRLDDIEVTMDPTTGGALLADEGPASGGSEVTLTGEGFHPNMMGTFTDTSGNTFDLNALGSFTVLNSQTATFTTPPHSADLVDLTIQNPMVEFNDPDGTFISRDSTAITVDDAFEYLFRVDSLTASTGTAAGGSVVTLAGEGFHTNMTAKFVDNDGNQSPLTTLNVTDARTATFTTDRHAAGFVDLVLQNPDYTGDDPSGNPTTFTFPEHTTDNAFEFRFTIDTLTVNATTSTSHAISAAGNTTVVINGEGFDTSMTCELVDGDGNRQPMTLTDIVVNADGANSMSFVTERHARGFVSVVIQNPQWSALNSAGSPVTLDSTIASLDNSLEFRFEIDSLSVGQGSAAGNTLVEITGEGFDPAMICELVDTTGNRQVMTLSNFVTGDGVNTVEFTTLLHAKGFVDVVIQNPTWDTLDPSGDPVTLDSTIASLDNSFEFRFELTSLDITSGPAAGGTLVEITGEGFHPSMVAELVDSSGNRQVQVLSNFVTGDGANTVEFTTQLHAEGFVELTLQNPDWSGLDSGGAAMTFASPVASLLNAFEFLFYITSVEEAPTDSQVPASGGTLITITGKGFAAAMSAKLVDSQSRFQNLILTVTPGDAQDPLDPDIATFMTSNREPGFMRLDLQNPDWSGFDAAGTPMTFTSPLESFNNALEFQFLVSGLDNTSGPAAGGQTVTISGEGFHAGMTGRLVDFSGNSQDITLMNIAVDGTSAEFITSLHGEGIVDLRLENPDWSGFDPNGIAQTFLNPELNAPNIYEFLFFITDWEVTSADAYTGTKQGPASGGNEVTITGEGFHSGMDLIIIDEDGNYQDLTGTLVFTGTTGVTFTTPLHRKGIVDIEIQNPNWTAHDPNGFLTSFVSPAETAFDAFEFLFYITNLEEFVSGLPEGIVLGGETVTIFGEGFSDDGAGMTGTFIDKDGDRDTLTITVVSSTEATFVTPLHEHGFMDIELQNPTYSSFNSLGQLVMLDSPIESAEDVFEYLFRVDTVTANSGPASGGDLVTVDGAGFTTLMRAIWRNADGVESEITYSIVNSNQFTFTSPPHSPGVQDLVLQNFIMGTFEPEPLGPELVFEDAYNYEFRIDFSSPASGPASGGTLVTIDGQGFATGMTGVFRDSDGSDTVLDITVNSPIEATFVTPLHTRGFVDLVVKNPDFPILDENGEDAFLENTEAVRDDAFEYEFFITSLDVTSGPASGGTLVTVTGEGFDSNIVGSLLDIDGNPTELTITVASSTSLSFVTPEHPRGFADLVLQNPDYEVILGGVTQDISSAAETLQDAFEFIFRIDTLTPATGPASGGTPITVNGEGFGLTVTAQFQDTSGNLVALDITRDSSTQLTFTTPAAGKGLVDLILTNSVGPSVTGEDLFEYLFQIDTLDVASGPASGGTLVNVAGEGYDPAMTATIRDEDGVETALDITVVDEQNFFFTPPAHSFG